MVTSLSRSPTSMADPLYLPPPPLQLPFSNSHNYPSFLSSAKSHYEIVIIAEGLMLDLQYFSSTGLSAENSPHVSERWKANLVALSRSVVGQTFMVNQLVDMEWKFGVTAGSSDLKVVGQTFLQLKMVVDRGGTQEDVFMELTLPQFYSFLHEMERAKSTLEYFS